jgi:hypothetical protein
MFLDVIVNADKTMLEFHVSAIPFTTEASVAAGERGMRIAISYIGVGAESLRPYEAASRYGSMVFTVCLLNLPYARLYIRIALP